jgi:hypothetical protein
MTLRLYAARHNWPLRRVIVTLRHEDVRTADKKVALDRFLRNIELSGDLNGEQGSCWISRAVSCQPHTAAPFQIVTELSPNSTSA